GVTKDGYVAGARSDQSNITLDGVDINEAQTNALESPVLRLNSEAIEEFRVATLNPNANQGRSSAAQVNLVTKSGSNDFHGALFEFYRGTLFEANDFFTNGIGLARTPLVRNTFGGAFGGPLVKDKLFFFYSYEGRRDATATPVVQTVPLASMGQGSLRYVDENGGVQTLTMSQLNAAFPAVGINPAAVAVLADAAKKYPANDFTVGDSLADRPLNTAGFRFNAPTPVHLNSHVAKFDWNVTNRQTTFARINNIHDSTGQAPQYPDTPAPRTWSHPWVIASGHTWTNPSGYQQGGNVVSDAVSAYLASNNLPALVSVSETQNAATALIGRYSQYTANFTFDHGGNLLPSGTPTDRNFATEDYDFYIQDAWKLARNFTLTYVLRYGLSRPVYETKGFEVKPDISLSDYFARRVDSAAKGVPYNDPLTLNLSGPANGKSGMYPWDLTGFQPRVAIAWSPSFEKGWLRSILGSPDKSVLRAGFGMLNDYYGEALATFFDLNNTLGFSSSDVIPVNTYNVTNKPAPPFTGYNQDVRTLPRIVLPDQLKFPLQQPADMGERIESSLDSALRRPRAYTFSVT